MFTLCYLRQHYNIIFLQQMASSIETYVNRMVSIITADGRNFVGEILLIFEEIKISYDHAITDDNIYS